MRCRSVKAALGDDLLLAAQEAGLAFVAQLAAVVDFDVFLGRHRKKDASPPKYSIAPASLSAAATA